MDKGQRLTALALRKRFGIEMQKVRDHLRDAFKPAGYGMLVITQDGEACMVEYLRACMATRSGLVTGVIVDDPTVPKGKDVVMIAINAARKFADRVTYETQRDLEEALRALSKRG